MRSIWSGDAKNAFYSSESFDSQRILALAEETYDAKKAKTCYYVLGVDVGRIGCTTEVCVFKVSPQPMGTSIKSLVNIYTYEAKDFEEQSIALKKLYYKYKARSIAIDANGLGVGLVDFLTKSQVDPETGDVLPPFGVEGGTTENVTDLYKDIKGAGVEANALFLIKANANLNSEAYSYAHTQLSSSKIKFLIDEAQAKTKLMTTKAGQAMTSEQRNEYLRPYVLTSSLKGQMLNLAEENQGVNIVLKQVSHSIPKDKFSAFIYGLYYIKQEEDRQKKKRRRSMSDFMFFS